MTTETPSLFKSLKPELQNGATFEDGDVALILKKDGRVQAISMFENPERLADKEPEDLTEDEQAMLRQGQKLFALSLAATNPQLLSVLEEFAADPDIVDTEMLAQIGRPN